MIENITLFDSFASNVKLLCSNSLFLITSERDIIGTHAPEAGITKVQIGGWRCNVVHKRNS